MLKEHAPVMSISWERLHQDSRALAAALRPLGPFSALVAVSRGGLVPGAIVAKELDIRLVQTVCISSYDGRQQHEPEVIKAIEGDGRGVLVIDDIADTGATAEVVRRLLPGAHLACVYAKPRGKPYADTTAVDVPQNMWLSFPWEVEE